MGKISNYLEMIEDIKNKTPEKEAFCTGNSSLTYRELFLLVKEKQKKWKTAALWFLHRIFVSVQFFYLLPYPLEELPAHSPFPDRSETLSIGLMPVPSG